MASCSNSSRPGRRQSRLALCGRPPGADLCGCGLDLERRRHVNVWLYSIRKPEQVRRFGELLRSELHLLGDLLGREFAFPEMPKLPLLIRSQRIY